MWFQYLLAPTSLISMTFQRVAHVNRITVIKICNQGLCNCGQSFFSRWGKTYVAAQTGNRHSWPPLPPGHSGAVLDLKPPKECNSVQHWIDSKSPCSWQVGHREICKSYVSLCVLTDTAIPYAFVSKQIIWSWIFYTTSDSTYVCHSVGAVRLVIILCLINTKFDG